MENGASEMWILSPFNACGVGSFGLSVVIISIVVTMRRHLNRLVSVIPSFPNGKRHECKQIPSSSPVKINKTTVWQWVRLLVCCVRTPKTWTRHRFVSSNRMKIRGNSVQIPLYHKQYKVLFSFHMRAATSTILYIYTQRPIMDNIFRLFTLHTMRRKTWPIVRRTKRHWHFSTAVYNKNT